MTHLEHIARFRPSQPCHATHLTFGGRCLNCGWDPADPSAPAPCYPRDCYPCSLVAGGGASSCATHGRIAVRIR